MADQGSDKRRFPRVALDVVLFFKVDRPPEVRLKIGDVTRTGFAVDISEVGISFLVDAEIPKGSEMEINFSLMIQKGKSERIAVKGVVVYCFPRSPKKTYRIGVLFTEVNDHDKALIGEYVKILFLHPKRNDRQPRGDKG
ncbi:MAG: PilZ domain-containing protein [Deltaproteobacteria bacterium]